MSFRESNGSSAGELSAYLEEHAERFEQELCELLAIPSVSTDPSHQGDVRRAAQWVLDQFARMGLGSELIETAGHPIVWAESPEVPGAPTVLVYGHYDVQPPDPLDEWLSPPFEPTRRDGNLYARGATDDKGQMLTHVKSAQAWMETAGRLPVKLKFVIEGEEEIGSGNLARLLAKHPERLAADVVVISDTSQFAPGLPAITYGLRGIAYFELRLTGPRQDLHSGTFGGGVANPAAALARMLAGLTDADGRIQLDGFYDSVAPLDSRERAEFARLPFDEGRFRERLGVDALAGEPGYTTLERRWARPSFDVNGLKAGYQGAGAKTVLPARAEAKFSFRLVPNQDPQQVSQSLRARLQQLCPPGIRMELLDHHSSPGFVVPLDSPYMSAAARAIERGFGASPVMIREGGSIPIVAQMHHQLGADVLLLGWGQDDDNTHGPNEKFSLADFHRGIAASGHLWDELSRATPKPAA